VVEYGGFLGFGRNEVALPAERVALRGDEVVLLGLSKQGLDAMPDYDAGREENLPQDATLDVGVLEQ
jgi:hypothetical protein